MERGSDKHGPKLDEEMKEEAQAVERSGKESRVEDEREKESATGHRISGSGTSTDDYPYRNRGEEGGSSHPKPRDDENGS